MHDLKALRAFVAVAHDGSVSPAVSLKLKQLQEILGLAPSSVMRRGLH